jgi:hypothetical protein
LANTRTEPSKPKPSLSEDDGIVELRPPAGSGFSGVAKLLAVEQSALIIELLKRGYTKVDRDRD